MDNYKFPLRSWVPPPHTLFDMKSNYKLGKCLAYLLSDRKCINLEGIADSVRSNSMLVLIQCYYIL